MPFTFTADEEIPDEEIAPEVPVVEQPRPIVPPPIAWQTGGALPPSVSAPIGLGEMELERPQELSTIMAGPRVLPHAWQVANRPLIPLSKLKVSPETAESALQVLSAESPELTEEESQAVLEQPTAPGTLAKTTAGIQGSVLSGAESMTSPLMLSTLGLAALPKMVGRLVSGGFAADMLSKVPEASQRLGRAVTTGDAEEIAAAATDLAQLGAFTTAAGKHAVGPRAPVALPESLQELAKEPSTTGEPNAVPERQAAEVYGGVPEQPRIDEGKLPAAKGPEGVPPGGVPPGNAPGPVGAKEAGGREVPLTELPEQFRNNPVADTAELVKDVSAEDLTAYRGTLGGGATGFMWDLGAKAKTPEDVAALRKIAEDASAQTKALTAAGDLMGAMKIIGRQPAEAYEFATGVKLDGTPKWTTMEKMAERKGQTYTPPVPDPQYLKAKGIEAPAKAAEPLAVETKAQPEVSKVASEEGKRSAEDIKDELINELQKKLADASSEPTAEKVTIEIPGDGTFKVRNTVEAISSTLEAARKLRTDTKAPGVPKAAIKASAGAIAKSAGATKGTEPPPERGSPVPLPRAPVVAPAPPPPRQPKAARPPAPAPAPTAPVPPPPAPPRAAAKRVSIDDEAEIEAAAAEQAGTPPPSPPAAPPAAPPTPPGGAPPGGSTPPPPPTPPPPGGMPPGPPTPPPPRPPGIVSRALNFVRGVHGALKVASAQLAGKSAPRTSVASIESGNALVRYASAKIAAPLVAKEMATEVLGTHYRDADFGERLGAVLVEDRLRGIKDAFIKAGDQTAARKVNSLVGQEDSPFPTEASFQRALADPEIRAAIDRHKRTVQPTAEAAHEEAGGTLAGPGLNTGAFVNLKAIFEGGEENLLGGGGRGNLMNPLRRPSRFAKAAAGTAEKYETDYRTIAERMIEGNFEENTKRQMYDRLVADGLAEILDPGDPAPVIGDKKTVKFVIERKGVPAGENKARTYVKNLWVREDLAPEVRQALNTDGPVQRSGIVAAATLLNRIQLAGPTDAVWHTANMLGSIAGSQGGKNALIDVARKLPGVNITDAIGRTVASSIRVLRDTPAIQTQLAELGTIGAGRAKGPTSRVSPVNLMHKMITLVDQAGRLVRDDMYKNLVRRGLVEDTEANRREWVNQMGQYNGRLMGQFQRFFKDAGFSPFIVAGRNFNRMALRRLTLDPGIKAISPAAAAQMRAVEFLGTAATIFAIPALFNYLLTGSPAGRPGTKMGQIDTGRDDQGKHVVIDPAQWTGLRRGMRISGLQAVIEGARRGETRGRISQDAIRDILGGVIHPWAGPAVTAATVAGTGYTPGGYKESENPKDYGENIKTALEQLNPLANAYLKGKREDTGGIKQLGLSLGGAAGIKEVKPFTAYNRIGSVHESWLANNKDPKVKADYERNQAATFPVTKYRALDRALAKRDEAGAVKAIADLKAEGQKNKEILARMRPYVGQGANTRVKPLFHESHRLEALFRNSLTPEQRKEYRQALDERAATWREFLKAWRKRGSTTAPSLKFNFIPDRGQ